MSKHIFFIHGRNYKPAKNRLKQSWFDATRHALQRDHGDARVAAFNSVKKTFIYFGDHSNAFLSKLYAEGRYHKDYNESRDWPDRQQCLQLLRRWKKRDFLGFRGKENYFNLPGRSSLQESIADIFDVPLNALGLSQLIIESATPDMKEYWNDDSNFASNVRSELTRKLGNALKAGDQVLLIAHSLGSIISYDVMWKFSHMSEHAAVRDKKVDTWLTLGCPLADETVKDNLKGSGTNRHPGNIGKWINVAAEDDYVAHDEKVANDFRHLKQLGLVDSITDDRVYNLAVRGGSSNPHHGAGYLTHPKVSEIIARWLD